jgi:hypothetical protein
VPRLAALALLLALALAGCGASSNSASDFDGAERDVADAIEELEKAAQEDEPGRICEDLLAKDVLTTIGSDCTGKIAKAIDTTDQFALTVEDVTVTGTTAKARVETGLDEEKVETVELVKEGDDWKVAGLPAA